MLSTARVAAARGLVRASSNARSKLGRARQTRVDSANHHASQQFARRGMATVTDSPLARRVEMTNHEAGQGHWVPYQKMAENLAIIRQRLSKPLTLTEKVSDQLRCPRRPQRPPSITPH